MALAARNIAEAIKPITVSHDSTGCLLDLSVLLDINLCPRLDLWLPAKHTWEAPSDDTMYIYPTEKKMMERGGYAPQPWCSNTAATGIEIDVLALVNLGVLTQVEAQLYISLLNAIKGTIELDIDLSISLLGLINVNLNLGDVKKCVKHFKPHCHKKIDIPPTNPGCKTIPATDSTDCLRKCHKWAADLNIAANVQVGNLASIVDCTAISFNPLTVQNCLMVTVANVASLLVDAEVDTLLRL